MKLLLGIGGGLLAGYAISKMVGEAQAVCPPALPCPNVPQSAQNVFNELEKQRLALAAFKDAIGRIPVLGPAALEQLAKVGL